MIFPWSETGVLSSLMSKDYSSDICAGPNEGIGAFKQLEIDKAISKLPIKNNSKQLLQR
jgi:hypothetical protein